MEKGCLLDSDYFVQSGKKFSEQHHTLQMSVHYMCLLYLEHSMVKLSLNS